MKWIKRGVLAFICGLILTVGAYYGAVEKVSTNDLVADNGPNSEPSGS
ncbi:hypothetical protein ACFQ40_16590 [Kroppenstedtia eburnea]